MRQRRAFERRLREHAAFDFALVALIAFVARLTHAWFLSRTPFFEGPVIDAQVNRMIATQLAASGDVGAFYQPPLYAGFLSLLFRGGLSGAWSLALVQSLLGSLTATLLVTVGRRLASHRQWARRVGLVCGVTAALYGPLILFDLELLPPCLVNLLLVACLRLALRTAPLGLPDALLGLFSGLAVTGWPPSGVLLLSLWWLRGRCLTSGRALLVASLLSCAAIPLGVTAQYNARHGAPGVVVSYNLGINFWLGNNPRWRDTWRARPGALFEPELERPDRAGFTTPVARSDYFVKRAWREIAQRPLAALSRTGEKLYYVFYGREIRRDNDLQILRDASPVLRVLSWDRGLKFPFGVLAPLALLGAWRRRREPEVRSLLLAVAVYALLLAAFFVSARYRLPLVLWFLPLAADEAVNVARQLQARQARSILLAAACLVLLLNLPNAFSTTFDAGPAERGVLTATAWRNQGNSVQAERLSAELLQHFPADPNVLMLRAELFLAHGSCRDASPLLSRLIEVAPRTATPRVRLADCYVELGNWRAAERELANALAIHPYHPLALRSASLLFAQQRRNREARALLARFLAAGYHDPHLVEQVREGSGS